jgi:endonuclease YncB( thermonuclease family)
MHVCPTTASLLILIVLALPAEAGVPALVGRASVVDGDTIEISGTRIRLHGIDAPESTQTCKDAVGKEYRCGQRAALALDDYLAQSRPTRCEPRGMDRYGRTIASCYRSSGDDVAGWLVTSGHALDWPRYSNGQYAGQQKLATEAHAGIWEGSFTLPWEWRRAKP